MDAIRGLVLPGFSDPRYGYYPENGWTVVEKADPGLVELADDRDPMIEILTDVTEGDPRFGEYPVLSTPEEPPDPGPPPPTYEELENQVGQLTSENAKLSEDLSTAQSENETLKTENADLAGQVSALGAQVSSLQAQLQESQQELADCQAQLPTADAGETGSSRKRGSKSEGE
jgi:hypothetical protein